jgi:hypothetical protein
MEEAMLADKERGASKPIHWRYFIFLVILKRYAPIKLQEGLLDLPKRSIVIAEQSTHFSLAAKRKGTWNPFFQPVIFALLLGH